MVRGGEGGESFGFLSPPPPLDRIVIFKALYLLRHSVPIKNQRGLHFQQPRCACFLERPRHSWENILSPANLSPPPESLCGPHCCCAQRRGPSESGLVPPLGMYK